MKGSEESKVCKKHVIDPNDGKKAVCGLPLTHHDTSAEECVDCRHELETAFENLASLVVEELEAKIHAERAQHNHQVQANKLLRARRLAEIAVREGVV